MMNIMEKPAVGPFVGVSFDEKKELIQWWADWLDNLF